MISSVYSYFFSRTMAAGAQQKNEDTYLMMTREGIDELFTADMRISPSSATRFDEIIAEKKVEKIIFCRGAEFILERCAFSADLKSLDLRALKCNDQLIAIVAEKFPNLTGLSLGSVHEPEGQDVSDAGVASLTQCRRLKVLTLDGFSKITDVGIKSLTVLASTLTELSLEFCQGITDNAVESFILLPRLEFLSLNGCLQISQATVQNLEGNHRLTTIGWPSGPVCHPGHV